MFYFAGIAKDKTIVMAALDVFNKFKGVTSLLFIVTSAAMSKLLP
jgi:hypothetical protein